MAQRALYRAISYFLLFVWQNEWFSNGISNAENVDRDTKIATVNTDKIQTNFDPGDLAYKVLLLIGRTRF